MVTESSKVIPDTNMEMDTQHFFFFTRHSLHFIIHTFYVSAPCNGKAATKGNFTPEPPISAHIDSR